MRLLKKIKVISLLLALSAEFTASTAYARSTDLFYMRLNGGGFKAKSLEGASSPVTTNINAALGCYLQDILTAQVNVNQVFSPEHAKKGLQKDSKIGNVKYNHKITAVHLEFFTHFVNFESFSLIGGLGIGASRIKSKYSFKGKDAKKKDIDFKASATSNSNISVAGTVGITMPFTNDMNLETLYTLRHYGKTKPFFDGDKNRLADGKDLIAQSLTIGIKFDI